jgi:hypothetical protein
LEGEGGGGSKAWGRGGGGKDRGAGESLELGEGRVPEGLEGNRVSASAGKGGKRVEEGGEAFQQEEGWEKTPTGKPQFLVREEGGSRGETEGGDVLTDPFEPIGLLENSVSRKREEGETNHL